MARVATSAVHRVRLSELYKLVVSVQTLPFRSVIDVFQNEQEFSFEHRINHRRMLHHDDVDPTVLNRWPNECVLNVESPTAPAAQANTVGRAALFWCLLYVNVVHLRDRLS